MIIRDRYIRTEKVEVLGKSFTLGEKLFKLPQIRKQITNDFKIQCGELGQKMIAELRDYYVPARDQLMTFHKKEFDETKARLLKEIEQAMKDNDVETITMSCNSLRQCIERKENELTKALLELGTAFDTFQRELRDCFEKKYEKILEHHNGLLFNTGVKINEYDQRYVWSDYTTISSNMAYAFQQNPYIFINGKLEPPALEYFDEVMAHKIEGLIKGY